MPSSKLPSTGMYSNVYMYCISERHPTCRIAKINTSQMQAPSKPLNLVLAINKHLKVPVLTGRIWTVVVNNINLTKLTTRTPHAIAAINYCLHHLYTWVSCATAALPTMSANCIPSELVVCRAALFFHTGVARARLANFLVYK